MYAMTTQRCDSVSYKISDVFLQQRAPARLTRVAASQDYFQNTETTSKSLKDFKIHLLLLFPLPSCFFLRFSFLFRDISSALQRC